jgi:ArsR family metal-binding transcriptional regulator
MKYNLPFLTMNSYNFYFLYNALLVGPSDNCIPGKIQEGISRTNSESITGTTPMKIKEFSKLLTCLGDPTKFRMVARLHPKPGDLIVAFEPLFEKAVYSKRMNALLIKIQSTIITIYASGIVTMTRLNNADQAAVLLNDVIGSINQSIKEVDLKRIRSDGESRKRLDPMEITAYLPRTNCAQCGVKSCFYFSTMLAYSEATLEKCQPLKEARYLANKRALEMLMIENLG